MLWSFVEHHANGETALVNQHLICCLFLISNIFRRLSLKYTQLTLLHDTIRQIVGMCVCVCVGGAGVCMCVWNIWTRNYYRPLNYHINQINPTLFKVTYGLCVGNTLEFDERRTLASQWTTLKRTWWVLSSRLVDSKIFRKIIQFEYFFLIRKLVVPTFKVRVFTID